jgi:hypothetical protein
MALQLPASATRQPAPKQLGPQQLPLLTLRHHAVCARINQTCGTCRLWAADCCADAVCFASSGEPCSSNPADLHACAADATSGCLRQTLPHALAKQVAHLTAMSGQVALCRIASAQAGCCYRTLLILHGIGCIDFSTVIMAATCSLRRLA